MTSLKIRGCSRPSEAEVKFDILRPGEVIWVAYMGSSESKVVRIASSDLGFSKRSYSLEILFEVASTFILALHTKFEPNRPIPKISKIAVIARSKRGRIKVSTYFVNWIWKFMYKLIEIHPKIRGGSRGTFSKLEAKLPKMQLSRGHCWGRMRGGSNLIGYNCYLIWGVPCHISRSKSIDPTRVTKCYI